MAKYWKRIDIPDHLLDNPVIFQENLIDPQTGKELQELVKELGRTSGYQTNAGMKAIKARKHEHIGDAQPPNKDTGKCDHPSQIMNGQGLCMLA